MHSSYHVLVQVWLLTCLGAPPILPGFINAAFKLVHSLCQLMTVGFSCVGASGIWETIWYKPMLLCL